MCQIVRVAVKLVERLLGVSALTATMTVGRREWKTVSSVWSIDLSASKMKGLMDLGEMQILWLCCEC
jgi:hypothetical protein